jgi:mannosyl-oligosaccharide alpha-1,2-mannosidase
MADRARLQPLNRRTLLRAGVGLGVAAAVPASGARANAAGPAQPAYPDGRPGRDWRPVAEDVRRELRRAWQTYQRYAWGHDELHPLTNSYGEFFDDAHPVGLTIVEALDTLYLMELDRELAQGVDWIRDHLDFRAVSTEVQIFETNIRMVGGLLSGYLATRDRVLLRAARDIADVLLPAFERSPTGMPYRFVVPSTGALSGTTNVLAEIGTIIAEFGTLSRLTHDRRYYDAAKKALKAVYDRRSPLDLVGTEINIETGEWTNPSARVDPPVDSFFEYLWDGWDLFGDRDLKRWYDVLTAAILRHEAEVYNGHLWFHRTNMTTGVLESRRTSELTSFYAGLLGQSGHLREGEAYFDSWTSMLDTFELLPEGLDYGTATATSPGNQLRPEYVDSAFNLWLITGKERYRDLAHEYYLRQKRNSRAGGAWTIITDVTTRPMTQGDLTSGYWWSEQMKYWYLMFGAARRFDYRDNYLSTEGNVFRGLRSGR